MEIIDIREPSEEDDNFYITVDMSPSEQSLYTEYGLRLGFLSMAMKITIDEALAIVEEEFRLRQEVEDFHDLDADIYDENLANTYKDLGL